MVPQKKSKKKRKMTLFGVFNTVYSHKNA